MSNVDFDNEDTQRASWAMVHSVMLNAMVEAVAEARKAVPTDNPRDALVRDGMILDQLHVVLCELVGETEGRILRMTMRTNEDVVTQREERIQTGLARGVGGGEKH